MTKDLWQILNEEGTGLFAGDLRPIHREEGTGSA